MQGSISWVGGARHRTSKPHHLSRQNHRLCCLYHPLPAHEGARHKKTMFNTHAYRGLVVENNRTRQGSHQWMIMCLVLLHDQQVCTTPLHLQLTPRTRSACCRNRHSLRSFLSYTHCWYRPIMASRWKPHTPFSLILHPRVTRSCTCGQSNNFNLWNASPSHAHSI